MDHLAGQAKSKKGKAAASSVVIGLESQITRCRRIGVETTRATPASILHFSPLHYR